MQCSLPQMAAENRTKFQHVHLISPPCPAPQDTKNENFCRRRVKKYGFQSHIPQGVHPYFMEVFKGELIFRVRFPFNPYIYYAYKINLFVEK